MVQMSLGNSGRFLNSEYHEFRHDAHTDSYNIDEFGDVEQTQYDLDSVDFDTKKKDSSFTTGARLESEGSAKSGRDIRDIPTIRD